MHGCHIVAFSTLTRDFYCQGPRSNFEIGGEPLVTQYWGEGGAGAQDTFSYYFFIILEILGGGGARALPAPLLRGL